MSDSTRRSLRTAYQTLIAALTTIPAIAAILLQIVPADSGAELAALVASVVAGVAVVTKVLNVLEDAGLIPAWLKAKAEEVPPVTVEPEVPEDELPVPVGKHEVPVDELPAEGNL